MLESLKLLRENIEAAVFHGNRLEQRSTHPDASEYASMVVRLKEMLQEINKKIHEEL